MNTNMKVSSLAQLDVQCSCGRRHRVPIRHIVTGEGALAGLAGVVRDFEGKNAFLVGDTHTYPLVGDQVRTILSEAGMCVRSHVFSRRAHYLTDEAAIGEMLIRLPQDTDLIVAVGSGTMNDISRTVSVRCRIPYVIVGTAPSMDGYASSTSAIICGPDKLSVPLGSPYGIVIDSELLITAPDEMLSAGIGDVLGKHVALADWRLAAREGREHDCPEIQALIEAACRRCQAGYRGVLRRERAAVNDMADTLVMSGVAISMFGTSRPCAGSEHQLAHVWEVAEIREGAPRINLHGNFVGLGTLATILLYREAGCEFDFSDLHYALPDPKEIEVILLEAGGWASRERLGVDRALFEASFVHAARNNPRYTLLTFLEEKGRLEHYARTVAEEMFGSNGFDR